MSELSEAEVSEIEARANAASQSYVVDWSKGEHALLQASGWRPANEDQPRTIATFDKEDGYLDLLFCAEARTDIPALIRDWRALKARVEELTTDWCQCGHSRDKHQFFSDHDECYECDQASEDLCCEWRPAPRPNENAALREQLAQAENARQEASATTDDLLNRNRELADQLDKLRTRILELETDIDTEAGYL